MKTIKALKYYSHGKFRDPDAAQEQIEALKEKFPDRDYTILINLRDGYERYRVVQYAEVEVDWPSDEDLGLPAIPDAPPWKWRNSSDPNEALEWHDYQAFIQRRNARIAGVTGPLRARLREKLNP